MYKIVSLGKIANVTTGFPFKGNFYSNEGIRVVRGENVTVGSLRWDSTKCWNTQFEHTEKYSLKENDVVIGMDGSRVGRNRAQVSAIDLPLLLAQRVACIRSTELSDQNYLYYLIRSDKFEQYVNKIQTGSSIPHISLKQIEDFPVAFPPLEKQKKIASVLSSLDSKIELNNRINAELEVMAKTLYDYWFVQFDFPNAEGKPYKTSGGAMVWNDELKREVPEGWEVAELSDIANILMGQSPPGESYNEEGVGMIFYQGCTDFGNRFPTVRKYTTEPSRFAKEGDILLSVRAPVGTLNIAKEDCCIGRGLAALNSKDDCITFLFGVMLNLRQVFDRRNADGTTFGSIIKDDLYSLKVIKPTTTILQKFHQLVNPSFVKQNTVELENLKLSELRDWLLPMLMNGQVKVSTQSEQEVTQTESIILSIPESKKGFAKQVLGGKIVSLFKDDPHFTNIKFQKLQFLAEHIAEADLNLNYYFQAAGPHDGVYMNTITNHFKNQKWFDRRDHKFVPLEKVEKIDDYYQGYFKPVISRLEQLFSLLANSTEAESEIIATVYAVWNNRLILSQPINSQLLIEDFYAWSERKQQYTQEQISEGLNWLKENQTEPKGFGKVIKRAKNKQ